MFSLMSCQVDTWLLPVESDFGNPVVVTDHFRPDFLSETYATKQVTQEDIFTDYHNSSNYQNFKQITYSAKSIIKVILICSK